MKLTVREAYGHDVYKDIARAHRAERRGLKSGQLAQLSVSDRSTYVAVRGLAEEEKGNILLDLERRRLNVKLGGTYDFHFAKIGLAKKIMWALRATDPAARIAAGIAVWSAILGTLLGLVGLVVGIWPLLKG